MIAMDLCYIMMNKGLNLVLCLASYFANITITEIFIALFLAILIYYGTSVIKHNRRLPPGPWGLPVVGYLPWMLGNRAPHATYLKMAATYGDVTSVTLGHNLVVCLGSVRMISELFSRYDSTGRPHTPLNNLLGGRGIMLSEGKLWKEQRQFLHQKFRSLGVQFWENQPFEKLILTEVEELKMNLENLNGASVNPSKLLGRHIHNVICQLMMSFRFTERDNEFLKFKETIAEGMKLYGSVLVGEHFPCYLYLPGKAVVIKEIEKNFQDTCEFHKYHVSRRIEQRSKYGHTDQAVDLLDCYLNLLDGDNVEAITKVFPEVSSKECVAKQLVQVMNDLFSAGMETSLSTVLWILVIMLREPAVVARVRDDLASVVAPGEMVTLAHRPRLPYIEAVIYETLRRVSPVPLGTTHVNSTDWYLNGYLVPAGSHLVPLINKIHLDPEAFPEPEQFRPERFLKDGKLLIPKKMMPFGLGRRRCLGEQLARMELFLFFTNIMNSFKFSLPEGQSMPGLEGELGVTHVPLPFELSFSKRPV